MNCVVCGSGLDGAHERWRRQEANLASELKAYMRQIDAEVPAAQKRRPLGVLGRILAHLASSFEVPEGEDRLFVDAGVTIDIRAETLAVEARAAL
jgi:hypothetical protein